MRYLLLILLLSGCADNVTPPVSIAAWDGDDPATPECLPNLDGRIDADELAPGFGVPANFVVNAPGTTVELDLNGLRDASGARVWDFRGVSQSDRELQVQAQTVEGTWFESEFPGAQFTTPLDPRGVELGVYSHSDNGLFLHGFVSSDPESNTLTQMRYTEPLLLYPFPLENGDEWISVGEVVNGQFRGLPYAGRDTYSSVVADTGEVWLDSIEFTDVLQVKTLVQVQPAVGASTSRVQVSWLFECFGEVVRAASEDGETDLDFSRASEFRRLGF